MASREGHLIVVDVLLKHGALVDLTDNVSTWNTSMFFTEFSHIETFDCLTRFVKRD